MKNKLLHNQKTFDKQLFDEFDNKGKEVLREILSQGSYRDIVLRVDELSDGDKYFWDVSGYNRNNVQIFFDVEIKRFWKCAEKLPHAVKIDGFSIPNRKSRTHNDKQGKTNYLVIISADLCGAFFVSKDVFEAASIIEKNTIYGVDKFRNILLENGRLFLKRNDIWQRQL